MSVDSASDSIIRQTPERYLDCVRLYFRPKTPTFYRNEGIRPEGQRAMDSHCPIPVALLFDSKEVLSRQGTLFADTSVARGDARIGSTAEFLRTLPFEYIYHDVAYPPDSEIGQDVHRSRQAEVLIPQEIAIKGCLRSVAVRSPAERQTLLTLMGERITDADFRNGGVIGVSKGPELFFKRWTFVDRITVQESAVRIEFNESSRTPGPFRVDGEILELDSGTPIWRGTMNEHTITRPIRVPFPENRNDDVRLRLYLDKCLAFEAVIDRLWQQVWVEDGS